MGLISKTVKIKWNSMTKKHYEELGYVYTKMGDEFEVKVEDLTKGSNVKVECICDNCSKELPWSYKVYKKCVKEDEKTYCNDCANKIILGKILQSNKKTKSFYNWCIENGRQDLLDRWDYELNDCSPKDIGYKSGKKYWFKCLIHSYHKSELKNIRNFVNGHEGSIDCKQCNSFAQWLIDTYGENALELYWDYDKNTVDPWEISRGCHIKIWIKCQEKDYHGSYETSCNTFINGARCPYCNKKSGKIHPLDSLGQYVIDNYGEEFLWKVWSDKNKISPFNISFGSNKKVWWNCLDGEHEPYKRSCKNSTFCEFRCPKCTKEREESFIEEKTRLYLEELGYEVKTEHSCSIRPINPKTGHPLPFDNEIILENGKHLIIEVHGEQHYKIGGKYCKTEKDLYNRRLLDRYKKIKCIQAGYEYLEIPYTIFNKEEIYKKLIDNKIKEILEKEE